MLCLPFKTIQKLFFQKNIIFWHPKNRAEHKFLIIKFDFNNIKSMIFIHIFKILVNPELKNQKNNLEASEPK